MQQSVWALDSIAHAEKNILTLLFDVLTHIHDTIASCLSTYRYPTYIHTYIRTQYPKYIHTYVQYNHHFARYIQIMYTYVCILDSTGVKLTPVWNNSTGWDRGRKIVQKNLLLLQTVQWCNFYWMLNVYWYRTLDSYVWCQSV